jgi:hypothetical protein
VKKINAVGVKSVGVVSLFLGFAMGVLYGIITLVDAIANRQTTAGIIALFVAPFIMSIMTALMNMLMSFIYNLVAARLGGIEVDIE